MLLTNRTVLGGSLWHIGHVWLLMLSCPRSIISELSVQAKRPRGFDTCLVLFEFHVSDHQQLSKLVQEAPTIAVREDLERELEALLRKMEAKADQISKVQRHRLQVSYL